MKNIFMSLPGQRPYMIYNCWPQSPNTVNSQLEGGLMNCVIFYTIQVFYSYEIDTS